MPTEQEIEQRKNAYDSIRQIQEFDVNLLPQSNRLATELNFESVVEPANRIINLYKQLSIKALDDIPIEELEKIASQARNDYSKFTDILNYTVNQNNPKNQRDALINAIISSYNTSFKCLLNYICYSTSMVVDFKRLESDGQKTIEIITKDGDELRQNLKKLKEQAENILENIRNAAAEQGVTQQAKYFSEESEKHNIKSINSYKHVIGWALTLVIFAILSMFLHKLPYLKPENTYDTVQLALSKILIFGVISYMLYLNAREYLAHKHNAVLNKHRQNALMTYTTIVDAAKENMNKDIILNHASACIYAPQSTGFIGQQGGSEAPSAKSVVELFNKSLSGHSG